AWYGGRGPGLLAAVLAVVAIDFYFRPHVFTVEFTLQDLFDLGIFALAALVTGSLAETQRRSEQALRNREEWLQTTLSSIGDAVIVSDLQGKVSFLNPVAEVLTGWKLTEALGRDMREVFQIVNQYTRQQVENPVEKVLRDGLIVGLANHTVLLARDGREIPIDDSGAPIRDAAGHVSGAVLVFRDVSERQKTQAMQAQLAAIVESSDDAIIGKNLDAI